MTAPKYRPLTFGVTRVTLTSGGGAEGAGVQYLSAEQKLNDYPVRMTDRLAHWAHTAPERTFMAKREKLADDKTPNGVDRAPSSADKTPGDLDVVSDATNNVAVRTRKTKANG